MATKLDLLVEVLVKGNRSLKSVGDDLDNATTKTKGLKGNLKDLSATAKTAFSPQTLAIGGIAAGVGVLTAGIVGAFESLKEIERLNAQTNAVIKSTGGAAGITAGHVDDLTHSIEDLTGIQAEATQEGVNLLLTFTNIKNVAGEGNAIFDRATQAITDMSVALGQDVSSSAVQLGKALNDPIKGITALSRVGVSFTEKQKKVIKSLVETGDVAGAQRVILDELAKEFGGSAEAFGETTAGKIEKLKNKIGDFFEAIVTGTAEAVDTFDKLSNEDIGFDFLAANFGDQGDRIHDIADRLGEDFNVLKAKIVTRMSETGESFDEAADKIEGGLKAKLTPALKAGEDAWNSYSTSISNATDGIIAATEGLTEAELQVIYDHWDVIKAAGTETVKQYNIGIFEAQTSLQTEIDALLAALDERLTPSEEIGKLHGQLMTFALAREAAVAANDPFAVAKIDEMMATIRNQINALSGSFDQTGANIVTAIVNGMRRQAAIDQANGNLYAIGNIIRKGVGINSEPEDPRSPLRGITKWGGNMVTTIAEGITANLGVAERATDKMASAFVPQLSPIVPAVSAPRIASPASIGGTTGTGGAVVAGGVNVNLTVQGDLKADERTLPGIMIRGLYSSGLVPQ